MAAQLKGIRDEVKTLADRVLLLLGGMALLAFLLPVAAPFIRSLLGL